MFRKGAELGQGGNLVSIVISHLWSTLVAQGAVILQADGDSVAAFFESGKTTNLRRRVVQSSVAIERLLQQLSTNLADSELSVALSSGGLHFRAAAVEGAVKPIWRKVGEERHAAWIEAGGSNVFVDAARLLEIEKQVPNAEEISILVVTPDFEKDESVGSSTLPQAWLSHDMESLGKHGRSYRFSLFSPTLQLREGEEKVTRPA